MIAIIALSLTFLGSSVSAVDVQFSASAVVGSSVSVLSNVEVQTESFYRCIACAGSGEGRAGYMRCHQFFPPTWQIVFDTCIIEFGAQLQKVDKLWGKICTNEDGFHDYLYNCWVKNAPRSDELNEVERPLAKLFVECNKNLASQYCVGLK